MSNINPGVCIMCGMPLLVLTLDGRMRPFCPECEKKVNQKVAQSMANRGKDTRNKQVVFAKIPEAAL